MDNRIIKFMHTIIDYSVNLQKGENILIEYIDTPDEVISAFVNYCTNLGANVFLSHHSGEIEKELLMNSSEEYWKLKQSIDLNIMKNINAYIRFNDHRNHESLSTVPNSQIAIRNKFNRPVSDIRCNNTKWCIFNFPTDYLAKDANMSLEEYTDYFYKVCCVDYNKMKMTAKIIAELMNKTDKVHIIGKDTDLTFSIKNIPSVICCGTCNIPDGEVYTAPVINSINGYVKYNTKTTYNNHTFSNIRLQFKDGKIIDYSSDDRDIESIKILDSIFNTDSGAKFIGEFALGINDAVTKPMNDILFDEKIKGSFHLTPGQAYKDADNSNRSAIHWDLVCIQTKEYGGGEIWFDDKLIRKDGIFAY